jgi:hypothetical protein
MRLEEDETKVLVVLSRKNLLTGLHKLGMEGSARTIYSTTAGPKVLILQFEEDEEHYNHSSREVKAPGVMHPETEQFISGTNPTSQ